jgi:cytochrome c-type biogenesis protein CcmH/NrfF
MGGLGHHPSHPYAAQVAALLWTMLLPGGLVALALGAWWEQARRSGSRHLRLISARRLNATKRFIRANGRDKAAA